MDTKKQKQTICSVRPEAFEGIHILSSSNNYCGNYSCGKYSSQFIFVSLWYPRKYFNMNQLISTRTFSYCTCIVDIACKY